MSPHFNRPIAEEIRNLRTTMRYSEAEFSCLLEISQYELQLIEEGQLSPDVFVILSILDIKKSFRGLLPKLMVSV